MVKALVSLGVLFGYPLQFFIAIQIMLPDALRIMRCVNRPVLGEYLFRTLMVLVTRKLFWSQASFDLLTAIVLFSSLCSCHRTSGTRARIVHISYWRIVFDCFGLGFSTNY